MNGATVLILTYTTLHVHINSIGVCNCATIYVTEPDRIPTATYTRSVEMLYPLWFTLCVLFLASSVTIAQECRHTPSVMYSAELVQNAHWGGHVWIHVLGLTAPLSPWPQQEAGKTMFASPWAYYGAWNAFVYFRGGPFSTCPGSSGVRTDCIPATALGIPTTAYRCTSASGGLCTAGTPIVARTVIFAYHAKPGVGWILNTAYPSANPNC